MFIAEHIIQRKILREMIKGETRRFSDIKPEGVESNLFLYHLRQLTSAGLIKKLPSGEYSLTKEGRQYTDRSNLDSMVQRLQPKQITVLVLRSPSGKYVLLKRYHVPYIDFVGFPSGKIHYGESLQEAAERELANKTGLEEIRMHLRGVFVMRFLKPKSDEVESHITAFVFAGTVPEAAFHNKTEFYETYLGDEKELFGPKSFRGHKEIIEKVDSNDGLFIEDRTFESTY